MRLGDGVHQQIRIVGQGDPPGVSGVSVLTSGASLAGAGNSVTVGGQQLRIVNKTDQVSLAPKSQQISILNPDGSLSALPLGSSQHQPSVKILNSDGSLSNVSQYNTVSTVNVKQQPQVKILNADGTLSPATAQGQQIRILNPDGTFSELKQQSGVVRGAKSDDTGLQFLRQQSTSSAVMASPKKISLAQAQELEPPSTRADEPLGCRSCSLVRGHHGRLTVFGVHCAMLRVQAGPGAPRWRLKEVARHMGAALQVK